jgi:hypothetical protein
VRFPLPFLVAASITLAAAACAHPTVVEDESLGGRSYWDIPPETDVVLAFERQGCLGACPAYVVTVHDDRGVDYFGRAYVSEQGRHQSRIPRSSLTELLTWMQQRGFFDEPDRTHADATDGPTVRMYAKCNGQSHFLSHSSADRSAPAWLEDLELRIDEVLGTVRWVGEEHRMTKSRIRYSGDEIVPEPYDLGNPPDIVPRH